jgi:uncharacterized protein (DUF362 family)/Pyruvate/2-oxoacid:ferredoxin oxidoreductase delta subunit
MYIRSMTNSSVAPDAREDKMVSLVRCEDYERQRVLGSVKQAIEQIGGLGAFVAPGLRVFLKTNLLAGADPAKCVTTHPEVVFAVARLLLDHGCTVVIGDSPGSGLVYSQNTLKKAYAASGLEKIATELSVELNYDISSRDVSAPEGRMVKRFKVISPALDCDAIVVVSKAKTHMLTYVSGAAKNLFGVIPGFDKPAYHATLQQADSFSRMILDLNALLQPRLQIVDAVMAMEGDGPLSGTPRKIGAIVAGADANAVDAILARLMSIEPKRVATIAAAIERGMLREDLSDISVTGEPVEEMIVRDFKPPMTYLGASPGSLTKRSLMGLFFRLFKNYAPRPRIVAKDCVVCLKCKRSCPVQAIHIVNQKPRIDHAKCIRCYCCHEMCDSKAIRLERTLWGRLIARMVG